MENETISTPQQSPMPKQKNSLGVPVAIVIAGLLIGGAVIYSNKGDNVSDVKIANDSKVATPAKSLVITPVKDTDYVLGDKNADVVFIEYSDMECPFCKTFHNTMHKIVDEYGKSGKVAWVYRHYPIDQLHPKARKEAEAVECAGELGGSQKFWQYLDRIFAITPSNNGLDPAKLTTTATEIGLNSNAFSTCLQSGKHAEKVESDSKEAVKSGGNGTPHTTVLLKRPMSDASRKILEANFDGIRDQNGELLIVITPDNSTIVMKGAMPYEIIKPTLLEVLR